MKNMTPVLVDRLARALKAQGIELKRGKLIEISASMLGFHNSNEMQAAGSRGELVPAAAEPIGRLAMPDGTTIVVVRDTDSGAIFAYDPAALSKHLIDAVVVAPYGSLSKIEGIDVAVLPMIVGTALGSAGLIDADKLHTLIEAASSHGMIGGTASGGIGQLDADTLGTLIEAADSHGETLRGDLGDDEHPDEDAGRFLDEIEEAVRKARGLGGGVSTIETKVAAVGDLGDFRLVHKDVLVSLVGASTSYAEDLSSGMEDGTYQDDENVDRLHDIEQAIGAADAAQAAVPEDTQPAAGSRAVMHVATLANADGEERRYALTHRAMRDAVADYCRENWSSLSEHASDLPAPTLLATEDVIRIFYETSDAYSIGYRLAEDSATVDLTIEAAPAPEEAAEVAADLGHSKRLARVLTAAIKADVWDDDAAARRDAGAVQEIAEIKQAMLEAAAILRAVDVKDAPNLGKGIAGSGDEPIWTTDVEGDVIYSLTRDDLENLGLRYGMEDGEWLPLTEEEFSYLRPGSWMRGGDSGSMTTPDANGLEVRLGQSCVWKGQKWLVPSIEFAFDVDAEDKARVTTQMEAYVRDLRPLLDQLGGEVAINVDATEFAHEIDVFIPMETAIAFDSTENWAKALVWLLCPSDQRDRLVCVMASFTTPTSSPGYEVRWDATFDVLQEGLAKALAYVKGDQDDDLTMRYCESPLAHKDAHDLWNQNWDMELDMEALVKLFDIR